MESTLPFYEYIVVGCGGIGSGALYWLARRAGKSVLGLEQFKLGHDNGGSQDHSRIIRLMYNDEIYTKLTPYTYTTWAEVERESGLQLVYKTGSLDVTRKSTGHMAALEACATAMAKQNIPFERLPGPELHRRFPQWAASDDTVALYQKDGGLVDAALGNSTHLQLARHHGAHVIENCPVTRIDTLADGCAIVHTAKGAFKCRRVIVTAGAWVNHVLGSVGGYIPVTVTQEQVTYYATPHIKDFTKDRFPVWIYHDDKHSLYGLPIHGNSGSKIGIDVGGHPVTPDTRTYTPDPAREEICTAFLKEKIPKAVGPILYSKTCLYTMPKDRNFVVDSLGKKGKPQIIVCCGAGHAYKFASLLGQILSDLAIDGSTRHDISSFNIDRESITNPDFKPTFVMSYMAESKL